MNVPPYLADPDPTPAPSAGPCPYGPHAFCEWHRGWCGDHSAATPAPSADRFHFAPYGSINALCGETVPRRVSWDVKTGEYASPRFTVKRGRTTCPDCLRRMRGDVSAAVEHLGRLTRELHDRALRAEAKVARVEALASFPTGTLLSIGEWQPYAVDIDGEVHLAVLIDDLRDALDGA